MQTTAPLTQPLRFSEIRTYIIATIFIAGNILLPQLCHLATLGGPRWLPIYFFTLIGAWCYGWRVGIMTALLSPLINCIGFGMPAMAMLPAIMLKSSLLAILASYAATKSAIPMVVRMLAVIVGYQLLGTLGEWAITGSLYAATQDLRIGLPGMALQLLLGLPMVKLLKGARSL